ncbi:hypothetical protein [Amycolatopsis sp. NPDC098790]
MGSKKKDARFIITVRVSGPVTARAVTGTAAALVLVLLTVLYQLS